MKRVVCTVIIMLATGSLFGQYQVIVLKKGNIIARYNVDNNIRYSTSTKRHFKYDGIVEISDTTIITRNDTIPYHHIRLLDVRAKQRGGITMRRIGAYMIAGAILLPIADLINVTLIQGDPYEVNESMVITSLALASAGGLILLVDKPYKKIGRKTIVRIVDYKSPLYKAPTIIRQDPLLTLPKN